MPKVFVIGRRADILPFKAVGAELMEAQDQRQASAALANFRQSTEPMLVMMTEDMVNTCADDIAEFRQNRMNILLPIPTINTEPGKRLEEIRSLVARALGVDLLGRKET
jgi:vacuolar-type H+-ATPase subunit F/Vma7